MAHWRQLSGRNHEAGPDTLRVVLPAGFRARNRLQGIFGDSYARLITLVRRKKTAVCSGCRTRYRIFYDRRPRRVWDTDAAGWRIYVRMSTVGWPTHAVEGVTVERLDGWRRILAIGNGSPSKLAP